MATISQNVVPISAQKSVSKCAKKTNAPIRIAAKNVQPKDAKVVHVAKKQLHVAQLPMSAKRNVLKVNVPPLVK